MCYGSGSQHFCHKGLISWKTGFPWIRVRVGFWKIQVSSVTQSCPPLCDPMNFSTNSRSSPKLMFIKSVMPSSHLILCSPLLLLPSIFPSISVFSDKSLLYIRWPKYWCFSFTINPSNEHSGLISFRMDWLDLAVQGTLKSLLQHHSSNASILQHSAFFTLAISISCYGIYNN